MDYPICTICYFSMFPVNITILDYAYAFQKHRHMSYILYFTHQSV